MVKYDCLYEFIPYLETALTDNVVRWGGGEKSSDGTLIMPYPIYNDRVKDFIETIYKLDLLDKAYLETMQSYSINTSEELGNALDDADYRLSIALLTYYVRQERFCDGLWAKAIENKIFLRLIKRLLELEAKQEKD